MPSKKKANEAASKKAEQKRKNKIVEDKTFGLKNKNKSKKVQAYINATTKSVMNGGDAKKRKEEEQRKQAAKARKALKKAQEEERNALFGEALLAVKKKTTTKMKGQNEAKGRDHDEKPEKAGTSRAMKMMFQMDATEVSLVLSILIFFDCLMMCLILNLYLHKFQWIILLCFFFDIQSWFISDLSSCLSFTHLDHS